MELVVGFTIKVTEFILAKFTGIVLIYADTLVLLVWVFQVHDKQQCYRTRGWQLEEAKGTKMAIIAKASEKMD